MSSRVTCGYCSASFHSTDDLPDACPVCGRTVFGDEPKQFPAKPAPAPLPEEMKPLNMEDDLRRALAEAEAKCAALEAKLARVMAWAHKNLANRCKTCGTRCATACYHCGERGTWKGWTPAWEVQP